MTEEILNGLDLFSGIGGITKALVGYVEPVAYCEIESYARGVLFSRMADGSLPLAPIWDDVTTLRGYMLPKIDIIYGGFPCQDISVAGKQTGLGGERSSLFFEIVRLAKETNAEWLFLENVPNIRTKGLGEVLQTLADSGYDCRWGALSAADVGANHKRNRWFLLAHATRERCGETGTDSQRSEERFTSCGDVLADADGTGQRNSLPEGSPQNGSSGTSEGPRDVADAQGNGRGKTAWWTVEPNVGRVANGVPKRVDRLRALGNAVVPVQVREAFEKLMGFKGDSSAILE